jgi:hypothetical protein
VYRFWIISVIRLILATYRFIIQKPMLMIGMEVLSSLF